MLCSFEKCSFYGPHRRYCSNYWQCLACIAVKSTFTGGLFFCSCLKNVAFIVSERDIALVLDICFLLLTFCYQEASKMLFCMMFSWALSCMAVKSLLQMIYAFVISSIYWYWTRYCVNSWCIWLISWLDCSPTWGCQYNQGATQVWSA